MSFQMNWLVNAAVISYENDKIFLEELGLKCKNYYLHASFRHQHFHYSIEKINGNGRYGKEIRTTDGVEILNYLNENNLPNVLYKNVSKCMDEFYVLVQKKEDKYGLEMKVKIEEEIRKFDILTELDEKTQIFDEIFEFLYVFDLLLELRP